jgi:regulatory protein YycI of two-component signal transduction system YycFG
VPNQKPTAMNFLIATAVAILIVGILVTVLLLNSKTGHNIKLQGEILRIAHPLKEDVIDLQKDLKNWNVSRMNMLWRRRIYTINLELKGGSWKRVYFRSPSQDIQDLIAKLNELIPMKSGTSLPYARN